MADPNAVRDRLLAILTVLLVVAGLRWSQAVTMPVAAAVFIVAAAWPIKPWLDRALPSSLSYVGTTLALLLVLGGFLGAIYLATVQVVNSFAERQDQFRGLYEGYVAWAETNGLPVPEGQAGFGRLVAIARMLLAQLYTVLGYIGLVAVVVVLGLPEVPAFRRKIRDRLHELDQHEVFDTVERIASMFREYIGVTVVVSLITGAASAAWAFALGLDLALTWGVLNFLLNFVPVFGNIIGIIPPTLYAVLQYDGWTMPVVTFLGYAALQIAISNFVYPWMQGQRLSLSPAVVVVALSFWGWVWGVAGALLAVPLTAAVVIACGQFDGTRWIAKLLSKG